MSSDGWGGHLRQVEVSTGPLVLCKGHGKCVHKVGDFNKNDHDGFLGVLIKMAMDLCTMILVIGH